MADLSAFFGEDEEEDYYLYDEEGGKEVVGSLGELNISTKEEEKDCPIEADADINEELSLAINTPIPNNSGTNDELKINADQYSEEQEEELNNLPLIFLGKYAEDLEFESIDDTRGLEYLIKSVHAKTMARKLWATENMTSILNQNPWLEGYKNVFPLVKFILRSSNYELKNCLAQKFDELLLFVYKYIDAKNDYSPSDFDGIEFDSEICLILNSFILVPTYDMMSENETCFLKLDNFLENASSESIQHFFHTILKKIKEIEDKGQSYMESILTTSVKAISMTVRFLSIETINNDLIPVLRRMSSYQQYETRKESILCLSYLIESKFNDIDSDLMIRLYDNLVADNNHEVRHEACSNFKQIADTLVARNMEDNLIKWMDMLLDDTSSKVKSCAQIAIGPVIYAFRNSQIPASLMEKYIEMPNSPKPEVRLNCAKNFPGVLLALGPGGWLDMKEVLIQLSDDSFLEVRYVVASFLHELPSIISPESMTVDVIPIVNNYLASRNHVDLCLIIASNANKLLSKLEPSIQESIASSLHEFIIGNVAILTSNPDEKNCYSMRYSHINTRVPGYIEQIIPFMDQDNVESISQYCLYNMNAAHSNECKLNMTKLYGPITTRLLKLDPDGTKLCRFVIHVILPIFENAKTDYKFTQFCIMIGNEIIQASPSKRDIHSYIVSCFAKICKQNDKSVQLCLARLLKQTCDSEGSTKVKDCLHEELSAIYEQLKSTQDSDILYELSLVTFNPTF